MTGIWAMRSRTVVMGLGGAHPHEPQVFRNLRVICLKVVELVSGDGLYMVDRAEATPGLSGALLAAPWRAW